MAGVFHRKKGIHTNVRRNADGDYAGKIRVTDVTPCDTVDECFFGGRTATFKQHPFDEILCDGWHLYAVDRCLELQGHGGKILVSDIELTHPSDGFLDRAFIRTFLRLSRKYDGKYRTIRSCCCSCGTGKLGRCVGFFKLERNRVRCLFRRAFKRG